MLGLQSTRFSVQRRAIASKASGWIHFYGPIPRMVPGKCLKQLLRPEISCSLNPSIVSTKQMHRNCKEDTFLQISRGRGSLRNESHALLSRDLCLLLSLQNCMNKIRSGQQPHFKRYKIAIIAEDDVLPSTTFISTLPPTCHPSRSFHAHLQRISTIFHLGSVFLCCTATNFAKSQVLKRLQLYDVTTCETYKMLPQQGQKIHMGRN